MNYLGMLATIYVITMIVFAVHSVIRDNRDRLRWDKKEKNDAYADSLKHIIRDRENKIDELMKSVAYYREITK